MLRKGLLFLCFSFVAVFANGQGKIVDSLKYELRKANGAKKVDILNQLTFEFISVDNEEVIRYGNEALQLSRKINYTKGEGVANTYRGLYEYQSGQFEAARVSLHTGLRLSQTAKDKINEGYTYLQLGNAGLEEVNMDSAYVYLRKAYNVFKDSSHAENLSKVYRNLSALFGQKFEPDSQQYYLNKAIVIRRLLPDQSYLVDALAIQANNKFSTGNLPEASALLDEADRILEKYPNDLENLNDVKHVRALIYFQQGKFEEASVLFDSARNYYFRMSLFRKYVTLLTDLGKIFSDRGEYELALNNLYDALRLSISKGFETETFIIRTRIGWINFALEDYEQALAMATQTLRSPPTRLLKVDRANALNLKGVVLTEMNRLAEARSTLDSALSIVEAADDKQGISEIYMNLGVVESYASNYPKALGFYQKSLDYAARSNYIFGFAWCNWGIADIYYQQKKYDVAIKYLDEAEKYSNQAHANELLIFNYNTRRDILRAMGRFEEALTYSIKATNLKDSLRRSDLTQRFINLQKIEEIEQRDRNIKVLQQEKQLAEDKISLQESRLRQQYILIAAGLAIITLLILYFFRIRKLNITVTEKNHSIQAQSTKLHEVNQELNRLYQEVSEQNEEIQTQALELAATNRSIVDLNRGLEELVAQKTVELRKTNEELVKHNNELLQFSYTVSHNLRGPVARILGLASLMSVEHDIGQARQWVELISKTTGELDLIIKDLSKILELRREPHRFRDPVDLTREWQQSVRLLQDSMRGDEEIRYDFSALPELTTVRAMIQSMFYNLLSNALKFRSPDRLLRVEASSKIENGNAVIFVKDNGLGFDTELHKDKLFKLYTRFHSHVDGRGLGLYLIKSQLEVVHGGISVSSQLGAGTIFKITIPLITALQPEAVS